ncbi:MAG: dihydrolipoyl dehydrogenase [Alphaproteobacteria bacterium]
MTQSDLIIIGGGPGGYVAAIRAAQLGMKVTLVEKAQLGGICLNWGCIPTKALLRSSEIATLLKHADAYGFTIKEHSFDIKKIVDRSRKVAAQLSGGIKHLMKKNKVEVIEGHAKLLGKGQIEVTKDDQKTVTIAAKNIILATGARARVLPGLEPDGQLIWTYREAMVPPAMPKSLLVVGSGAIGIEFASFYRALGAEVTVVEVMDRVLPVEDEEISAFARKSFEKQGMKILTGATVKKLERGGDNVTATIEQGGKAQQLTVDRVIMAIGITGNTENMGLENTKVKVDRGHIVIDEWCATGEPGIYAIGDVAGPPWLAHKASHEGVVCVEKIAGVKGVHPLDAGNIPGCTYCTPQVASVGLTEAKAKAAGHEVKVGRFNFIGNGKAIAMGEPEGMVKTIFDAKTGALLGAHMIGPEVTEMIQGYTIARTLETTEAELMHTVFPHPTISETMHEAVLDAYGKVVHM